MQNKYTPVKIAILHEMLIKMWGAEKVVEVFSDLFPKADIYTLIYDEKKIWKFFPKDKIHSSVFSLPSQRLYSVFKKQRLCLPLMSRSVEKLDFSDYDYVIVSSSWFSHGLKTGEKTKTIVYYHAPARYMWDWTHEYRKEIWLHRWLKGFIFWRLLLKLRQWDFEAARKNDILLANSATTQKRIYKYYRRESQVLYPPIDTSRFEKKIDTSKISNISQNTFSPNSYYIVLSALTEFKRIEVAIENFKNIPESNLLIIWNGDYRETLQNLAGESKNIVFAGAQYWNDLVALVQNSLGLIFPGEEDFWIVPIEVMAAGKPVFALHKWGLTETVIAGVTWEFFMHPNGNDFIPTFQNFHAKNIAWEYKAKDCKKQAKKYDQEIFKAHIKKLVQ